MTYITKSDIKKASENEKYLPLKFGPVGSFVDVRTYRRWLPKEGRRETFFERNARVVNYSVGLAKDRLSEEEALYEARDMFDSMNQFKGFPSGRTLWCGGTEASRKHPANQFNCSSLAVNRISTFTTLANMLMLGVGVGLRVFQTDVDKLPDVRNRPKITYDEYDPLNSWDRDDDTHMMVGLHEVEVFVGDSREGWVEALKIFLEAHTDPFFTQTELRFNFDSVRPMGERIHGFGGTASGPESLRGILEDWTSIMSEIPSNRLRPIDCMDLCCSAAKGIIAGSSRRSALITLFDEDDVLISNAKVGLFDGNKLAHKRYRLQSNNTMCVGTKYRQKLREFLETYPDAKLNQIKEYIDRFTPSQEWFKKVFDVIASTGDPGIDNYLLMVAKKWVSVRRWRPECPVKEIWWKYCDIATNPLSEAA